MEGVHRHRLEWFTRLATVALRVTGAFILLGWLVGSQAMARIHPQLSAMKPNTALGFILVGVALRLRLTRLRTWVPTAVAGVAAFLALAMLVEHATGVDLGVDVLLPFDDPDALQDGSAPGRSAPASAFGIFVLALATALLDVTVRRWRPAQLLALVAILDGLIALLGYIYGVPALYAVERFASVSLITAAGLMLGGLAILAARPDAGIVRHVTADSATAALARRVVPVLVVLPIGLGWLRLQGQQAGWYDTRFGLALYATSTIICLLAALWWAFAAMREREVDLSITLDSIGDGVIVIDRGGTIVRTNPVAERLTGVPRARALGAPLAEVFRTTDDTATQLISRDGRTWPISTSRGAIRDGQDDVRGTVVVFHDQTEREAAVRAEEGNRLRDELLANMSHELRTPLNAVIGFSQLLLDPRTPLDPAEVRDYAGEILTSGRHLVRIIDDVLELSDAEAGRLTFARAPVDVAAAIDAAVEAISPAAQDKQLAIETRVDPALTDVVGDQARLQQVIGHLVSNAVKFTAPAGSVSVRAFGDGDDAFRIEVNDTGKGISAEDQAHLFVAFHQLDGGRAKHQQGLGLGLALARRIVEAQRGTIEVESEPGKGSTFRVRLRRRIPAH